MISDYNTLPTSTALSLENDNHHDTLGVEQLVECLLFVADGPVPIPQLAQALDLPPRQVETALAALEMTYAGRGLRLQRWQDRVQLTTAAGAASHIERFLGLSATTRLSHAAVETLAIIAYQQPVTRPQIEAVRGVNSDSVIKSLLTKGLIEEIGRGEGAGRPILYRTTPEFLQHFGLGSLAELPALNLPEVMAQAQAEQARMLEAAASNGSAEVAEAGPEATEAAVTEAIEVVVLEQTDLLPGEVAPAVEDAPATESSTEAIAPDEAIETEVGSEPAAEIQPEVEAPEPAASTDDDLPEITEVEPVETQPEAPKPVAPVTPGPEAPRPAWQGDWMPVSKDDAAGGKPTE